MPAQQQHATGPFEVKIAPLEPAFKTEDNSLGRMSIDKQFHGDLEATSKGQMLTASTDVKGSAGYVAIERVTGTLRTASGLHTGSFSLQHTGTLKRGTPELSVSVVPDSGTGQLADLTGKMNIIISDGKHSYDFEYTLPDAHKASACYPPDCKIFGSAGRTFAEDDASSMRAARSRARAPGHTTANVAIHNVPPTTKDTCAVESILTIFNTPCRTLPA
jgi:hypothetical protein